jgi:hypothetical protein
MEGLFKVLGSSEDWYGDYAVDVLQSILNTKEEYTAFRKVIVDTFKAEVGCLPLLDLLRDEQTQLAQVETNSALAASIRWPRAV